MLTDGKYEDLLTANETERRERSRRGYRFRAWIFALFGVAFLLLYVFVERDRNLPCTSAIFAMLAATNFWLSKRTGQ